MNLHPFLSHITEDMLRSPFRPATEIRRFYSEEFLFVIPILNPTDFKIVLCRDKLENLPCPQVLATVGSADDKPLIRFQLHQKLFGFRQRLTHIEIAPCPGVIVVSELDTNRFDNADVISRLSAEYHNLKGKLDAVDVAITDKRRHV